MRRLLLVVCCVSLLVLAGCSAPTTEDPPTSDVRLSLDNSDTETYELTVAVVPSTVDTLRITDANGTTRTFRNVSSLNSVPQDALGNATAFTATGPDVTTQSYVLEPQTGIGDELSETPQNATLLFLLTRPGADDPTRSWGAVTCGQSDFVELSVTIADGGSVSVSNHCRSVGS